MNSDFLYSCKAWISHTNPELLYRLVVTVGLLLAANLAFWLAAKLVQRHFAKRHLIWTEAIFYSVRLPGGVFIWLSGLCYELFVVTNSPLADTALHIIHLALIICFTWLMLRMTSFVEKVYSDENYAKSKQQRETVYTIARMVKVTFLIIGVLMLLEALGVSASGLVAFGGVGAAGLAFSAKDVLGNFFGGLMVFFNRPFSVGDWIRSPDREIEGTVEHIGWLLTRIRTFDLRPLYVPNGVFSSISIENPQRMLNRRIKETIGLRYDDATKISKITAAIKAMLKQHPEIDIRKTIIVNLINFGPSSLDILVYTFTKTIDWVKFQEVQQDVFLKIIDIITEHDAQCAFPTTTLHVADPILMAKIKED